MGFHSKQTWHPAVRHVGEALDRRQTAAATRHARDAGSHDEQSTRNSGLIEEVGYHLGDHVVPARQFLVPPQAAQPHHCLLQLCCTICHLHFTPGLVYMACKLHSAEAAL